jgi:hypothetical protein
MRLLILSPDYSKRVNWGHQHVRDYLLAQVEDSLQYGEKCKYRGKTHIPDICEEVGKPDAILMENWKNMSKYTGGAKVDCLKAFMVCDYMPDSRGHMVYYNDLLNNHKIDLAICPTPDVVYYIEDNKRKGYLSSSLQAEWIPHGVDTNIFMKRELIKKYDVMCVYGLVSYVYPNRSNVQELIRRMDVESLIGDWKSGIKHWEYARAINQSKIFVNCNGINNQVLMKYYEAMASGSLLLTNPPNSYNEFGFIPGEHFVTWHTLTELEDRILYYLTHDEYRERIAETGMKYVRNNFSADHIATKIRELLESCL